jgi:thiol:disulfide interchange protein
MSALPPLVPLPRSAARRARHLLACATLVGAAPLAAQAQAAVARDRSPHSDIVLVAPSTAAAPGSTITVAAYLTLDKGWHTYWLNPGDAGLPLKVKWSLPDGVTAGPLRFPTPHLAPQPPLMSYGYENAVLVLADIIVPDTVPVGTTLALRGTAEWLACAEQCLPAAGDLSLDLPVRSQSTGTSWAARIAATRTQLPQQPANWTATAALADSVFTVTIVAPNTASAAWPSPYVFVDSEYTVDHAAVQRIARRGDTTVIAIRQSPFATAAPPRIRGLFTGDTRAAQPQSWLIDAPLQSHGGAAIARSAALLASAGVITTGGVGGSATPAADIATTNTTPDASVPSPTADMSLIAAIAFAFIGGLLLNLMPCVFPVLSIKVLALLQQGGADTAHSRRHGFAFAAGVLASFWLLAGTLMALRAGGEQLGWGFQLQSPPAVAALAVLMFALALNLSGVFEIGMSLTRLGAAGGGGSYRDSVLTGLLAVAVAAPCTAPFMGAALGYALVQPAAVGLLVFTALGVGLALPFVVLTSVPALLRYLPTPGPWLETLKQFFAFPLYATVVWLLWVFGQQVGVDGLAVVLLALILVALAGWTWSRGARADRATVRATALVLGAAAIATAFTGASRMPARPAQIAAVDGWQPYSADKVRELRAQGRAVFIDFTAAWCLSCQVNERVALRTSAVREAFLKGDVALLRADWTSRDEGITATLASFGRSGVPLYVLYPRGAGAATVLPAVLSPGMVVDAVQAATTNALAASDVVR